MLDSVLQRCAERSPVTVMARLGLQQALEAAWIDELFESHRQSQYRRELLFSSTVELMSVVAVGLQPSVHAAAKAAKDLPVSITALYDKINRTEPGLVRALVCGSAQRLGQVVAGMCEQKADLVPGYQVRILDGNHLPASHKRLKPLRQVAGAALAGQSLVVYDPDRDMVVDLLPCEDAHAQERSLMGPILQSAQPGQLWIADRNFCTGAILAGWHERGSAFLVREHAANPNPVELGRPAQVGRAPTGVVYEQAVRMQSEQGTPILLRRIELRLDAPTEDGDSVIRLLSNLPADQFPGQQIAQLYRRRWKIEAMFQRLEAILQSEIVSLGHPRAALLAFGVAALAYNALALIATAIRIAHRLDSSKIELSAYFIAIQIKAHYAGMMMAVPPDSWQPFEAMTASQLAKTLLKIAAYADPQALRKHPRAPKKRIAKKKIDPSLLRKHVSTARVLIQARGKK